MFSFGWLEIVLIFFVVVLFIGPKDIPNFIKQISLISRSLKNFSNNFRDSLNSLAEEQDIKDIKNSFSELQDIKKSIDPNELLKDEIDTIKKTEIFTDEEIDNINSKFLKK